MTDEDQKPGSFPHGKGGGGGYTLSMGVEQKKKFYKWSRQYGAYLQDCLKACPTALPLSEDKKPLSGS